MLENRRTNKKRRKRGLGQWLLIVSLVADNRWYRLRYCPFFLYRPYRLKKKITRGERDPRDQSEVADNCRKQQQRSRTMVDSDFSSVSVVSSVPKCLKKKYLLCILIHITIYISDIIISIIYTTLITLGSEIRNQEWMGRDLVLLFSNIGKENGRTENTLSPFHPSPRGGVLGCRIGCWCVLTRTRATRCGVTLHASA